MILLWRSQRDTLWILPLPGLGDGPREALTAQAQLGPCFPGPPPTQVGRQPDGPVCHHYYTSSSQDLTT